VQQQQQQQQQRWFCHGSKILSFRADIEHFIEREKSSLFQITPILLHLNLAWNLL